MKNLFKYMVAAVFVAILLIGGIALSMSGVQYVTAQEATSTQFCQIEGKTISVTIYLTIPAFERASSIPQFQPQLNLGVLNVGECATSISTQVMYIYFQSPSQGMHGYVRLSDLIIAVQPPVAPTQVAQATVVGNQTLGGAAVNLGNANDTCQFRAGFTADQQGLGLPSASLRANAGTQVAGPALVVKTTAKDIVSVSTGFNIVHAGQTITTTGTNVVWLYDGDLATPGLQDCNVEGQYGFVAPLNP